MGTKSTQPKSNSKLEILRNRQIQQYQQRISEEKRTIADLTTQWERACVVNVIGMPVRHKRFGPGTIIEQNTRYLTVAFDSGNKQFIMPSAFLDGFLITTDHDVNDRLCSCMSMRQKIREAKENISSANRTISVLAAKKLLR